MVRLPEQSDWVVMLLLGSIMVIIVMLQELQRGATLRDFILQGMEDRSNLFPSWLLVSLVHVTLLSALLSQYVPIVPRNINNISIFGISLNKFGYTFWVLSLFYLGRTALSYLFFAFIGQAKIYKRFYFVASKFYFVLSLMLIAAVFVRYFAAFDRLLLLKITLLLSAVSFLVKNLFYVFHPSGVLPKEWYYKFLYICTLQIAPVLALWQLLFF